MTTATPQSALDAVRARRGDKVSAREWNKLRRFIADAQEKTVASRVRELQGTRAWSETMLHSIQVIADDYLECFRVWDRPGTPQLGSETVYVARPKLLRMSLATHDGVTFTRLDEQSKTATKVGEDPETWILTPAYVVGDVIEVEIRRGWTGVTEVDQQRGRPIDKNVDGRAWGVLPTA